MPEAVRTTLSAWRWEPYLSFESTELVDDMLLVAVVHDGPSGSERLGVYYSLEELTDTEEFVAYRTSALPEPTPLTA
jgi:hypothetical protein